MNKAPTQTKPAKKLSKVAAVKAVKKTPAKKLSKVAKASKPAKKMDMTQLNRQLNSVSKRVFIQHFVAFRRYAATGNKQPCVALLQKANYSEMTISTQCASAKRIFDAKKQCAALKLCVNAKIPAASQKRAMALQKQYCQ